MKRDREAIPLGSQLSSRTKGMDAPFPGRRGIADFGERARRVGSEEKRNVWISRWRERSRWEEEEAESNRETFPKPLTLG